MPFAEMMNAVSNEFKLKKTIRREHLEELRCFLHGKKVPQGEMEEPKEPRDFGWEYGAMILGLRISIPLNEFLWSADEVWEIARKQKKRFGKIWGIGREKDVRRVFKNGGLFDQIKQLDRASLSNREERDERQDFLPEKACLAASLFAWTELVEPFYAAMREAYDFDRSQFDLNRFLRTYKIADWKDVLYGDILSELEPEVDDGQ
jgi:hypothetical protein